MFETHLALIVAVAALIIAVRRQPRLPAYRLEWNDISGRYIYAKKLILLDEQAKPRSRQWTFSIDGDRSVIEFPDDYVFDEHWQVSLRCGKGEGGFRVEFMLHPPDDLPSRFLTVAFSPSPPVISLFDSKDKLLAKFP
jgi:hypothetical protein